MVVGDVRLGQLGLRHDRHGGDAAAALPFDGEGGRRERLRRHGVVGLHGLDRASDYCHSRAGARGHLRPHGPEEALRRLLRRDGNPRDGDARLPWRGHLPPGLGAVHRREHRIRGRQHLLRVAPAAYCQGGRPRPHLGPWLRAGLPRRRDAARGQHALVHAPRVVRHARQDLRREGVLRKCGNMVGALLDTALQGSPRAAGACSGPGRAEPGPRRPRPAPPHVAGDRPVQAAASVPGRLLALQRRHRHDHQDGHRLRRP
jgi:hypothetical protein